MSAQGISPRQDPQRSLDNEVESLEQLTAESTLESAASITNASADLNPIITSDNALSASAAEPEEEVLTTPVIVTTDESNVNTNHHT